MITVYYKFEFRNSDCLDLISIGRAFVLVDIDLHVRTLLIFVLIEVRCRVELGLPVASHFGVVVLDADIWIDLDEIGALAHAFDDETDKCRNQQATTGGRADDNVLHDVYLVVN